MQVLRNLNVPTRVTGTGSTAEQRWQLHRHDGAAGLSNAGAGNYGMGVAVGDYDNDGFPTSS